MLSFACDIYRNYSLIVSACREQIHKSHITFLPHVKKMSPILFIGSTIHLHWIGATNDICESDFMGAIFGKLTVSSKRN